MSILIALPHVYDFGALAVLERFEELGITFFEQDAEVNVAVGDIVTCKEMDFLQAVFLPVNAIAGMIEAGVVDCGIVGLAGIEDYGFERCLNSIFCSEYDIGLPNFELSLIVNDGFDEDNFTGINTIVTCYPVEVKAWLGPRLLHSIKVVAVADEPQVYSHLSNVGAVVDILEAGGSEQQVLFENDSYAFKKVADIYPQLRFKPNISVSDKSLAPLVDILNASLAKP